MAANVSPGDLDHALEVREALRAMLLANNGEPYDPGAQIVLERAARHARLEPAFAPDGAALVSRAKGVDAALGRILAAAFAAMLDGSWQRLKACPREVCGWAFYDRSTNASATWCSMSVCGGRAKAGAYYRRRRAAGH
jgi:predicted RNA-binding Zn ribbon-like protein